MDCLSDSAVERLITGTSEPDDLARFDAHVDGCQGCRERVATRARAHEVFLRTAATSAGGARAHDMEPPDPLVGRVVGDRYQVLRRIGRGGMGTVYEAEHVLIGRRVALKVLHAQWAQSRDVVRRFQNEARAAGTLGHPGILQALDMGRTEEGLPFLALELLEGRDLDAELAARGPLPVGEVVRIVTRIADALSAAHAAGIVHRDLKPENVFLTRDGDVKVLDFGISKIASSLISMPSTAPGAVMGTPAYMAPEQMQDAASATPLADVYALGVILYRLLTGDLPFRADSLPALLLAMVTKEPDPIRTRRRDVPEELDAIVRRAMSATPDARFDSMEALARAIAPFDARTERPSTRPPPAGSDRRIASVLVVVGAPDPTSLRETVERLGGRLAANVAKGTVPSETSVAKGTVPSETSVAKGTVPSETSEVSVAVFGERSWLGDESARAVEAGLALRPSARAVAVATGHVEPNDEGVRGEAVERAIEACDAELAGVAVVRPTSAIENAFALRRVTDDLAEVRSHATTGWSLFPSQMGEAQPLLGREVEVAGVRAALDRAAGSDATVLAITGGAGMGKTRLAAELVRLAESGAPPPLVLPGRADPRGGPRTLLASALAARARWGSTSRGWPRLDRDAPIGERRSAVLALAREAVSDERAQSLVPFLGELLGVPMPGTSELTAARATPRLMSDRITAALSEYLEGVTRRHPVVIVLEDVQWADPESLSLVEQLVRDVARDRPLLLVGTGRPELAPALPPPFDDADALDVRLRGLGASDVQTLAAWITGDEIGDDDARALVDRTGGNPFFLEQILRARTHAGSPSEHATLPIDVETAVQAHLDALPEDERAVLRAAAVIAGAFTATELEALGIAGAAEQLASLARAGLLRRRSGGGSVSWELRTPLTGEVLYGLLHDDVRRALHREVAPIVARRNEVDPELVAIHFERGDVPSEAAHFHHRAAIEAARTHDAHKMLRCAERALALGAPADAGFSLQRIRAEALEVMGRLDEQGRALAEAARLASTPEERAIVATAQAVRTLRLESPAASLEAFERAADAAREADDPLLLARALGRRATALAYLGRIDEASGLLSEMELLVMTRAPGARAEAASYRAQIAGVSGDLGARRAAYRASVALYGELGDLRNEAGASVNLADVLNRFGAYAEAESALTEAVDRCARLRMELMRGYALANRGYARTMLGRHAESERDLEVALAIGGSSGDGRLALYALLYRSRLALARDDARAAIADAREVAETARAHGVESAAVLAGVVEARAHHRAGDLPAALTAIETATALRDRLGGLEEDEAELFATRADLLDAAGNSHEATRVRDEGRRRLLTTADRIADPTWRARFLTDVPAHRALVG